jgi:hypothetical protein
VLPTLTIDKHAVLEAHNEILQRLSLIPGDTTMVAKTTIAMRLAPLTVQACLHNFKRGILGDLAMPYDIGKTLFDASRPGGKWPLAQEDLEVLGNEAMTALFHSVLRVVENARPDAETMRQQANVRAAKERIQRELCDPTRSLDAILSKTTATIHQPQMAAAAEDDARARSRVEMLPQLDEWWHMATDQHPDLPFLYPRDLGDPKVGLTRLPRIYAVRGEQWIYDPDEHRLFGRTWHSSEALRLESCATAFFHPNLYTTHTEELLRLWFGESMNAYAEAGRLYVQ